MMHRCMLFLSSNQSYTLTDTGTCNLMDHSKTEKENLASKSFTVMQSHTGISGSNVVILIEVGKNLCIMHIISYEDEFLMLT